MRGRLIILMVHFLFFALLAGCQKDEVAIIPSQIIISPLEEVFLIGESAFFSIALQNSQEIPIEILGEYQFHLIAPNGEDIYPQAMSSDSKSQEKGVIVGSQDTVELAYQIPPYVNLFQLGRYVLWVEISDGPDNVIKSNDAVFYVAEKDYDVSSEDINLMISSESISKLGDTLNFQAHFTNSSNEPVTFLKPQNGSTMGWIYPMYLFIITHQSGNSLEFFGNEAIETPIYSPDTMFTIMPEDSYQITDQVPRFQGLEHPGTYKIKLLYIVRDQEIYSPIELLPSEGPFQPEQIEWDETVFLGHIMSNEITVTIEE